MKMGLLLATFMGLLIAAAFWVVVMNRTSPEVVNAAVPLVFAALSALALVFAFARPEPIFQTFPVTFFAQRSDRLPIVIPFRGFSANALALPDRLRQADSTMLDEPPGTSFGSIVYHDLLQKALVDWIAFRHPKTWRMRSDRFETGTFTEHFGPTADAENYSSRILSESELAEAFEENRFAELQGGLGTLALPPGTEFTVGRPGEAGQEREIRFRNPLCDLVIRTRLGISGVGLGPYRSLLGLGWDSQDDYWQMQFIVRIDASFSRLRIGHPQMSAHREWVTGIVEGLRYTFDEERIWRRTEEAFMLTRHLPRTADGVDPPLGPMRWQSPPP